MSKLIVLDSLKQAGRTVGHEINRAWESLSEGWRELLSRSSDALTEFVRDTSEQTHERSAAAGFPNWSLLASEVEETGTDVLIRVELPGIGKDDCRITIEGNMFYVSGERRFERQSRDSTYHVMERAYGVFQRAIPLPSNVDVDQAEALCNNGVLSVRLPKTGATAAGSDPVC